MSDIVLPSDPVAPMNNAAWFVRNAPGMGTAATMPLPDRRARAVGSGAITRNAVIVGDVCANTLGHRRHWPPRNTAFWNGSPYLERLSRSFLFNAVARPTWDRSGSPFRPIAFRAAMANLLTQA